jgi:hypothetical protein
MSWSKILKSIQKEIATAIAITMYVGVENTTFTDNDNEIISLVLLASFQSQIGTQKNKEGILYEETS